ncbi:polar amino acid ABC transporter permease [Amaricoccus sp. HAR-UPW-R2A-40]|nr:polar amino acid ABC transporter permease [Amaricoccus sp. HAR-UPW-R2A-40]
MGYAWDFSWLAPYLPDLAAGVLVTLELIFLGSVVGVSLGTLCAWTRALGPAWAKSVVGVYVELIRNTPFLIQLFFIFFGLPALGLKLTQFQAATLTMVVNLGAYSCEIIRAGIQATPRGQFEAGASLAMSPIQTFVHVVLTPSLQRIWPALSSQIVIVMLGSSVVSQISVEELTFVASYIQSRNFRAFETYIVSAAIYLALAILLRMFLGWVGGLIFRRKAAR